MKNRFSGHSTHDRRPIRRSILRSLFLCGIGLITGCVILLSQDHKSDLVVAQGVKKQEDQLIREFKLPSSPPQAPVYRPQSPVYRPAPTAPAPDYAPASEVAPPAESALSQPQLTAEPSS